MPDSVLSYLQIPVLILRVEALINFKATYYKEIDLLSLHEKTYNRTGSKTI